MTHSAAASTTPTLTPLTKNPYVGPTSFRAGDPLYGRTHERDDLLDLLIAERIVLLYSPSGAGKTSLLQAALVQSLVDARFEVLPIIRVTHTLPSDGVLPAPRNRYVMSTLLSLEEGVPKDLQHPVAALARTSLVEYLRRWPDLDGRPGNEVLIFDQFEEVLTADPTDEDAKREFFTELGEVLRNRQHWAIFAMREDFLAALDPYLRYIPTRFRTRYRLDLLTADAALEAVVNPARDAGVTFARDAAVNLVDDLRRVLVQRPDGAEQVLGPYVEPVQLQVACNLLWSRLPAGASAITQADDTVLGGVEEALGRYYAERVATAARRTGTREGAIRDWFEEQLITPQGLRGQVLEGPLGGSEADRRLLKELVAAHLVRPERRRQAIWYELAHDRFIEPIKRDNAAWRLEHLTSFERAVMLWESEKRPDQLLLVGPALRQAEGDVGAGESLNERERQFLEASRIADDRSKRETRNALRTRHLARGLALAVVVLLAVGAAAAFAFLQTRAARDQLSDTQGELAEQKQRFGAMYGVQANLSWNQELSVALAAALTDVGSSPGLDPNTRNVLYETVSASPVTLAMRGHQGPVPTAALSADGGVAVTASESALYVWDRATGERQEMIMSDGDAIVSVDASGDGGQVVAALERGAIAWWDLASGDQRSWDVAAGATAAAISPQGDRVASVSRNEWIEIWDGLGKNMFRVGDPQTTAVNAVFSPDGSLLATASDGNDVVVWDAASGEERGRVSLAGPGFQLQFGLDGSTLATVDQYGTATVWEWASGTQVHPPRDDYSAHYRSLSYDATRVLSMQPWGQVEVFDLATDKLVSEAYVPGAELAAAGFDPVDASKVIVLPTVNEPSVWQTQPSLEHAPSAVSPEDSGLFSGWDDGHISVTDAIGHNRSTPIVESDGIVTLDAAPDGSSVAVATLAGDVHVWDARTGRQSLDLDEGSRILNAVEFVPNRASLVTSDDAGRVTLWNAVTGREERDLANLDWDSISDVVVSSDGEQVLVSRGAAVNQSTVARLSASSTQAVAMLVPVEGSPSIPLKFPAETPGPLSAGVGDVQGSAFSQDGLLAALVTSLGHAAVFDTQNGRIVWHKELHPQGVSAVSFTPAGELLTVVDDHRVLMTNGFTGDAIREVSYPSFIMAATVYEGGESLSAYTYSGFLNVVPLDDAKLIDEVRAKVVHDLTADECDRYGLPAC